MNAPRRLLLCALALLASGCGQDTSDLEAFATEVRSRPTATIEPIPEIRSYTPYTYRAQDRREPFAPTVDTREAVAQSTSDLRPDTNRSLEPLEAFPLDALRMVGTITAQGVPHALIHAPDGVVYRLTRGNHLGQNYGEIVAVTDTGVEITEIVPDGMGGYRKRSASIAPSQ